MLPDIDGLGFAVLSKGILKPPKCRLLWLRQREESDIVVGLEMALMFI
jgi:hypothetical protein